MNKQILELKNNILKASDILLQKSIEHYPVKETDCFIDKLPFFSFRTNFKKNLYEQFVNTIYHSDEMKEETMQEQFQIMLEKTGITVDKKNELVFKTLKELSAKKVPFMTLDYEAYSAYVTNMEQFIVFSTDFSFDRLVLLFYAVSEYNFGTRPTPYKKEETGYVFHKSLYEKYIEEPFEEVEAFWECYEDLLFGSSTNRLNYWVDTEDFDTTKFNGDLEQTFISSKGKHFGFSDQNNNTFYKETAEKTSAKIKDYIELVIDLVHIKELSISEDLIQKVLEETYSKMLRIIMDYQISELVEKEKITKKDIAQNCHIDKSRFSNSLSIYGEHSLRYSDIEAISTHYKITLGIN